MAPLTEFFKRAGKLAADNSPTILTAIGVTGTLTTAFFTGKASWQAAEMIYEAEMDAPPLDNKEKLNLVWKLYVPAIGSAVMTVVCIVAANRIGTRRAAGIAAAYTLSEKAFSEYKEKIIEKMGPKSEKAAREELAQERIDRNPVDERMIISTGKGTDLCYEAFTGRYFRSNVQAIRKAQNDTTLLTINDGYASLTDFYNFLGLSQTTHSDEVGWNTDKVLDIEITACLSPDDIPCIYMGYNVTPTREYGCLH
jgi:hypothetical protein